MSSALSTQLACRFIFARNTLLGHYQIADLPGARLGEASGASITIDVNAAGYG